MKSPLAAIFVCLAALSLFAEPFSNLSFDAASKQAGQTGKLVLVDFYTTWCGPCKLLDKTTWTDAAVIKLLGQKTVALRIDAEKETELAKRYKIDAYPSVLLIKPDGTELDRLIGYRDAKTFIADFSAALNGKDSITRSKEALIAAGTNDPMARMNYAKTLAQKGKDAEALEEYLWCFDHGLEASPAFVGVRLSFLLMEIKNLAGRYPAAKEALESRREERRVKLMAGSPDIYNVMDLVGINNALDQKDKNLVLLDQLPAESLLRDTVASQIVDQLLEARRYADVLGRKDAKAAFGQQIDRFNRVLTTMAKDSPMRGQMEENLRQYMVTAGAHSFEALAGLKRNEEGEELAREILKFDSSATTRASLTEAAGRAGNTELAHYLKK